MPPAYEWEQIQRIFLAVADLAPSERNAVLEQMCRGETALRAEVESLLLTDLTSETAFGAAFADAIQTEAKSLLDTSRIEGKRLGAYRVIREIGRGGMGSVYLAQRADDQYESDVAIKVVRPGLDTDFILRRFRRERQILARLQHPNIARLFDGGTEKNTPYLVMEYVQGARITKYSEDRRLRVEDRVRLFLPVCSAVEYAHRAFIVHRDLKPGNILVDTTGTPKLLDFGLSKLLHSEPPDLGDPQEAVMATLDYASPEQIVGDPVTGGFGRVFAGGGAVRTAERRAPPSHRRRRAGGTGTGHLCGANGAPERGSAQQSRVGGPPGGRPRCNHPPCHGERSGAALLLGGTLSG
jgi:tRNA A-37 threonylcarbamoyl transferase component Bud32